MDVESTMLPLGTKMPSFNLLGIDGEMYTNEIFDGKKGSLVMFICCLLYTSPSPRDLSTSRMPSSG